MRRIIFRTVVSFCLLSFLISSVSCKKDYDGWDTPTETETDDLLPTDASQYVIITPEVASETALRAAGYLKLAIKEITGVSPEWSDDFFPSDPTKHEILVGKTNRSFSETVCEKPLKVLDYLVAESQGQIALVAGTDETLQDAVDAFIAKYVASAGIRMRANERYVYQHEYPINDIVIQNKSISDFVIVASDRFTKEGAEQFQAMIAEKVGALLPILSDAVHESPAITFSHANDADFSKPITAFDVGWSCRNDCMSFVSGSLTSFAYAIEDFDSLYLSGKEKTVFIEENKERIRSMQSDRAFVASKDYLQTVQAQADAQKESVLSATASLSGYAGTVYYVSNEGNDANDGKTPQTPWATIEKINSADLKSGDIILFERGGEWRGTGIKNGELKPDGTRHHFLNGIIFSNYGDMNKPLPIINGSAQNYADVKLWETTAYPNVWKCTESLRNVGVMVFDHSGELGDYNAQFGKILFHKASDKNFYEPRGNRPLGVADLTDDLQFYSDLNNDTLYLYSEKGNPGERFDSIEIGVNDILLNIAGVGNTVDGLHFRFCGNTAVGGGAAKNVTIRNCMIEWIGGACMSAEMLYGNGISFYGEVQNLTVENNWLYQIYDTGITFQISSRGEGHCRYRNIDIRQNLVEYCHWGIEFYNQPREGTIRSTENVKIEENICRFAGMGYGSKYRYECYDVSTVRNASAALLCSWGLTDDTENFVIKKNLFESCTGALGLVTMPNDVGDKKIVWDGNTYIQKEDYSFGKLYSEFYNMDNSTEKTVKNILNDPNAILAFILEQ